MPAAGAHAPGAGLDCAALVTAASSLLQGLGGQGAPQDVQNVLKLAMASARSCAGVNEEHFTTRAVGILSRSLEAAGVEGAGSMLAADSIYGAQQAAAAHACQLQAVRAALAARNLRQLVMLAPGHPTPPRHVTPRADYLGGLRHAMAAASTPAGQSASTAGERAPQLRAVLEDGREVAVQLSADPSDPRRCRLALRVLAPGRTLAAAASLLLVSRRAHLVRASLHVQLQAQACQRSANTQLLSSQRGRLLAARVGQPLPHAHAALARLLREAGVDRRHALKLGQQGQQAAASVAVGPSTTARQARQRRQQLNEAVLAQHREAKKAWRERRAREQRERMEALRSNDVEAYMRLVAQERGVRSAKIERLLSETDGCLRQLAARLRGMGADDVLAAPGAAGGLSDGGGLAALEQSHEAWNRLAAAFQADLPHQPKLLTGGKLREYQMAGLRWMVGLRNAGVNGILADEMGLGKTVQVAALLCHLAEQGEERPSLVAVPPSVLPNWEAELARWAPGLRVVSYKGSAEAREAVWEKRMACGRGGRAGPGTHVVLVAYDFLMSRADKPRLSRVAWSYLVVDEGHRLKNAGCKLNAELRAYSLRHRLLLTGTPLQNRLEELWSLLNFLMPSLFTSGEDFQQWFGGAERRGPACGTGDAPDDGTSDDEGAAAAEAAMLTEEEALLVTNRLHQVLRPFMLRRLKESVVAELPQKSERLLPVLPSPYQQALFALMQRETQGGGGGRGGSLRGVNNVLMECRNVCNHPLISRLHPEGAETALPMHPLPPEVRLCSKLELLDRALAKLRAGGHKVLLFCTMTRALDVLADHLHWRGWPHLRMDGATPAAERGDLVARFNDPAGGVFVFLLSIRAGGVGLNLQGADTVVMYDTDWNPQMDLQAQARAHRMGQTREVLVLRLKTVGTVEERVVGVASDKAQLADRSITGGFFDGHTSAEQRQRYLLDTIRAAQQQQVPRGSDQACGQLSDGQLNQLLARGPDELALFEAEDRRMQEAELASWRAAQSVAAGGRVGGRKHLSGGAAHSFSRLATAEEVAPLVRQAEQLLQPKADADEGKELGRGKRLRGTASYRDIGERAFVRLCQEGVEEGQAPAQLLAPASTASLLAAQATDPAAAAVKRRKLAPAEPVTATRPDDQLGPILTCSGPVPTAANSVLGEDAPEAATGQLAAPRAHQPMTPPAERKCSHCGATSTSHWRRHPGTRARLCDRCGTHLRWHNRLPGEEPAVAAQPTEVPAATAESPVVPAANAAGATLPTEPVHPAVGSAPAAGAAPVDAAASGGRHCTHCSRKITSHWRRHPKTRALLCNRCGNHAHRHGGLPDLEQPGAEAGQAEPADGSGALHVAAAPSLPAPAAAEPPSVPAEAAAPSLWPVQAALRLPCAAGASTAPPAVTTSAEAVAPAAGSQPAVPVAAGQAPSAPALALATHAAGSPGAGGSATPADTGAAPQCANCGTYSTTRWRRDPRTQAPLCNNCASFLGKRKRHRTTEEIAASLARLERQQHGRAHGPLGCQKAAAGGRAAEKRWPPGRRGGTLVHKFNSEREGDRSTCYSHCCALRRKDEDASP